MLFQKVKINLLPVICLITALLSYNTVWAEELESFEHIRTITKDFVAKNVMTDPEDTVDIQVGDANTALKLPTCSQPIIPSLPHNSSKENINTVELTCDGANSWHVYIPVDVEISTKVVVAKNTIPAKETITEDDIGYSMYNKNRLYSGFFKNKDEVVGNKAVHLIPAGTVFTKKNIQAAMLIYRNQVVTVVARRNAIAVSVQCIAKADGALNSVIKVYNPSSKQTLDAVVTGPNKAEVLA